MNLLGESLKQRPPKEQSSGFGDREGNSQAAVPAGDAPLERARPARDTDGEILRPWPEKISQVKGQRTGESQPVFPCPLIFIALRY